MANKRTKARDTARPAPGTRWRLRRRRAGEVDGDRGTWTIVSWHGAEKYKYAILRQHPLDDIAVDERTLRRLYEPAT